MSTLPENMNNQVAIRTHYINLLKRVLTGVVYDESGWGRVVKSEPGSVRRPLTYSRRLVKNIIINELASRSIQLVKTRSFDTSARENGHDWPFIGYTMVGMRRLDNLQMCIENVLNRDVPGDFIETGVWRGGATIFMRALLEIYGDDNRKVWVADSFEGMPVPRDDDDGWDLSSIECLAVTVDQVKANFDKFGLLDDQVEFLPGWFSETLPDAPINQLAILRLDGDLYTSTMDVLTALYDKVSDGGYVIVDDYHSWPSCHRAVEDFFVEASFSQPEIVDIDGSAVYWVRDRSGE